MRVGDKTLALIGHKGCRVSFFGNIQKPLFEQNPDKLLHMALLWARRLDKFRLSDIASYLNCFGSLWYLFQTNNHKRNFDYYYGEQSDTLVNLRFIYFHVGLHRLDSIWMGVKLENMSVLFKLCMQVAHSQTLCQ